MMKPKPGSNLSKLPFHAQSKSQNASPSHFEMENPSESYIPQYFLNMILFIFPLINFTSEVL
jgi:hypothetical protein